MNNSAYSGPSGAFRVYEVNSDYLNLVKSGKLEFRAPSIASHMIMPGAFYYQERGSYDYIRLSGSLGGVNRMLNAEVFSFDRAKTIVDTVILDLLIGVMSGEGSEVDNMEYIRNVEPEYVRINNEYLSRGRPYPNMYLLDAVKAHAKDTTPKQTDANSWLIEATVMTPYALEAWTIGGDYFPLIIKSLKREIIPINNWHLLFETTGGDMSR